MYTYCLSLAMYIHMRYLGLSCLSANRTDLQTKLQCLCWETMILKSTRIFGYLFFRRKPGGVGVHIHPNIQGPAKHGGHFGLFWGRGMLCKARTAEAIGPHHLGKHGKAWRCPGGSRRLRAGTGERERSESAMIDAGSLMGQWLKQLFQAKINV